MSGSYGGFAELYDAFMSQTDYDGWVAYIVELLTRHSAIQNPNLLLDLGCGTGGASGRLAARGYDVIGLDASAEMLSVAKAKNPDILYIQQDIRSFELYGTVDAVIALCDVVNYILTKSDLRSVFRLVANYLNPGGLFIFDINTPYKYRRALGNRVLTEQTPGAEYIWDNRYYPDSRVNEYRLTFYKKRGDGLYERFRERHLQRAHSPRTLRALLEAAGLDVLAVCGDKSFDPPAPDAERAFFVARKP